MIELRRLIVRHRHVAPMVSALLAAMDAAVVVATAVEELSRLPHGARGFLLLANGDALRGAAPGSDRQGSPVTGGRVGDGIVGAAAASGGAELVDDARADNRATDAERAGGSLVVAALRAGDRTLGVVGATATGGARTSRW